MIILLLYIIIIYNDLKNINIFIKHLDFLF